MLSATADSGLTGRRRQLGQTLISLEPVVIQCPLESTAYSGAIRPEQSEYRIEDAEVSQTQIKLRQRNPSWMNLIHTSYQLELPSLYCDHKGQVIPSLRSVFCTAKGRGCALVCCWRRRGMMFASGRSVSGLLRRWWPARRSDEKACKKQARGVNPRLHALARLKPSQQRRSARALDLIVPYRVKYRLFFFRSDCRLFCGDNPIWELAWLFRLVKVGKGGGWGWTRGSRGLLE